MAALREVEVARAKRGLSRLAGRAPVRFKVEGANLAEHPSLREGSVTRNFHLEMWGLGPISQGLQSVPFWFLR